MGWVDPWVGFGWVGLGRVGSRFFSVFGGLGWVGSTLAKVLKDYVNTFKARLDKIWLHQALKNC